MSARTIVALLPIEPAMRSVIVVEIDSQGGWIGSGRGSQLCAFQRMNDAMAMREGWCVAGGDYANPLTWPQIIGLAGGRPILVVWEPVEDEAVAT